MSWDDFERHQQRKNLPKRRKLFHELQSKDKDVISSFDSDSDTASPRKIPTTTKKPSQENPQPCQIDSFESDNSTNDCFSPKLRNYTTATHVVSKVQEFPVVQMKGEPKFDSSFIESEFEEDYNENMRSVTPPKKTVTSWLNGLTTPESSKTAGQCDKSAKKLASKKHQPGSLAHRGQGLARCRRGDYLLWLHKNIRTSKPSFNESCIFGRIAGMETEGAVVCVKAELLGSSRSPVVVMIPNSQKCGDIHRGNIIVVFPRFECFIKNALRYVVSTFHAQCFDETSHDFSKVPKHDHFQGIQEHKDGMPIKSQVSTSTSVSSPRESVGCYPSSLSVCIYHISSGCRRDHTQLLCCDAADNIIIVEVSRELAVKEWDKIGLSHRMTLHIGSLQLSHRATVGSCAAWFTPLALLTAHSNTPLHCFTVTHGDIALTGDVEYKPALLQGDKVDVVCVYLGTLDIDMKRAVTYVISTLGTLQWIESPHNTFIFEKGTCIKFSGLKCLSTKSYMYDSLSLVMSCLTDSTVSLRYPDLLSYDQEDDLSSLSPPPLPSFNQYLPLLSPCHIVMTISHVMYSDRVFSVCGVCCGVNLTVTLLPDTLRTLLRSTHIVSEELPRLKGVLLKCSGIVSGKHSVTQYHMTFLK